MKLDEHGRHVVSKLVREATLPRQFDELIWFDQSQAARPLVTDALG